MKSSSLCYTATACAVVIALISILTPISRADSILQWGHMWRSQNNAASPMNMQGGQDAHTVVPAEEMTISQIAVYGGDSRKGAPIYHIGVQGDDGTANHYPDGEWIGGEENFSISAIPSYDWETLALPTPVQLTKGVRYHIVIEAEFADAANYSSIWRNNQQPERTFFRVQDGVYDEAVGRERYRNSAWSRDIASFPILAIDTTNNKVIGQPWVAGENAFAGTKDWRYGQTFKLDIPTEAASVELVSFSLHVTQITGTPEDDLRVHLLRKGETTPLLSMVLMDCSVPGQAVGLKTVETPPIKLKTGGDYWLIVESTNATAAGSYRFLTTRGPITSAFPQAAEATFQGSASTFISSFRNGAWTPKSSYAAPVGPTDLVFGLGLLIPTPPPPGTVIILR